jgi:hypothetical protein
MLAAAWNYAGWFSILASSLLFGINERPYVYRVLIPWITRLLWLAGVPAPLALQIVVTLSAVALFAALCYLLTSFQAGDGLREYLIAFVGTLAFMFLFIWHGKVYDAATGAFFALSFALLQRRKLTAYYLLFPLACLNRETAVLLIAVFVFHFYRWNMQRWMCGAAYQVIVYGIIRAWLMWLYAGVAGAAFVFRPVANFWLFVYSPTLTAVHWLLFAAVIWLCVRRWQEKPLLLRSAFVVLFPALMAVYLLIGWSFEIRVFAELFGVALGLMTAKQKLPELVRE